MQKNYDIVVTGAGPAGCMFVNCIKKDYSILLLDAQQLPPKKICGGLLTDESIEFLKRHNLPIPSSVFSKPKKLKKIYVNLDKGIEKDQGIIYNVDRNRFNNWMLQLINKKVDVSEQIKLNTINTKDNGSIGLQLYDIKNKQIKEISCRYLVGADGVFSKVRKHLNMPIVTKYIAVQDYALSKPDVSNLYFFYSKSFVDHFIWIMPKEKQTIYGLPFAYVYGKPIDIKKINKAKKMVEQYMNITLTNGYRNGSLISIPQSLNELSCGKANILLIGEAAGWISPRSGDGISFALRSADNCAKAFNTPSENVLDTYIKNSQALKEDFHEKLQSFLKIQNKIKEYKKCNIH